MENWKKNVSRYADYKDWVKIPNEYLNRIKKQFSNFGLTYLSKFNFNYNVRAGYCTRDNIFFSCPKYNKPIYSEQNFAYKENSSAQTRSKIIHSTFNITKYQENK